MIYLLTVTLLMSWSLTWCMRRYALAKQLMDIPNHRSSHLYPTPRGGGVAFVLVFLLSISCLIYYHHLNWMGGRIIIFALFLIAVIGFLDDRKSLPVKWRFLGHIFVCILVLYGMSPIPAMNVLHWTIPPIVMFILAFFYLIWMLNLYNFMDGIDGLAGSQALFVCSAMSFLYLLTGYETHILPLLILAATIGGFLFWNFPPARIFMGDAGSGFLGLVLAIFSLQSLNLNQSFIWSWLILMGVFIVDTTWTLLVRFVYKEPVHQAHCSHAYQNATKLLSKHLNVTLNVFLINTVWLFPIALLVGFRLVNGLIGLVLAYIPLLLLALQLDAGRRNK